ncbi:putative serine protease 45 isoform X2 [Leopardus geoffroyi]|uniref:putative serine protease 45 isoform X2 n=1 Tax=Leopardus geoffroyi TaxID=46844 RepID=UPI001E265EF2|nr:putative serine protease 45 isoform X2 [Leopardus geoffroyi]
MFLSCAFCIFSDSQININCQPFECTEPGEGTKGAVRGWATRWPHRSWEFRRAFTTQTGGDTVTSLKQSGVFSRAWPPGGQSQIRGSEVIFEEEARGVPAQMPETRWWVSGNAWRVVTCWGPHHVTGSPSRAGGALVRQGRPHVSGLAAPRAWACRCHLPGLMAASPLLSCAGASGPWGLSHRLLLLLLLLPLLNSGYKENNSIPVCGRPWWSEDLDMTRHWPWEVSLRLENEHICGGALIDLSWVVTAAHCIQGTKEYSVILGTPKLKPVDFPKGISIPVKDIIMHPKYWGRTFIMGDIALLQLQTPAIFGKYVQPICLPEASYNLKVGTQCWVTGWGQVKQRFSANSTLTPELQEAEVFIMDNKRCNRIYRKKSLIPYLVPLVLGNMICATNYGENLCSGDSGGPLACEVEDRWILAGVLSWEKACAKAQNPGVYTRVTKYSKWIKQQISNGALSGPQTSAWLLLLFWLLQPQMGP